MRRVYGEGGSGGFVSRYADHPTVKPLQLMRYLITIGSRPGDVILGPFLGSGTTAAAAKELRRRYVGTERERDYFGIAQAWLAATTAMSIPRKPV